MTAKVFGPTLQAVTPSVPVDPADPSRGLLNREDIEVARAYHNATSVVRHRVWFLLLDTDAALDPHLADLTPARQQLIDDLIQELAALTRRERRQQTGGA